MISFFNMHKVTRHDSKYGETYFPSAFSRLSYLGAVNTDTLIIRINTIKVFKKKNYGKVINTEE